MTLNDLVGLGVIVVLAICAVVGLSHLSKPYNASIEEFEKRASEGPGMLGGG